MCTGNLRDIILKVQASTSPGETVCVSGSTPELGEWQVSRVLELVQEDANSNVWTRKIKIPVNHPVHFRYIKAIVLEAGPHLDRREVIVRHWETALTPRTILPSDHSVDRNATIDVFGVFGRKTRVEPGWLTSETVVELKLYNNPIILWKHRYRNLPYFYRISPIDISRKDSEPNPLIDDSEQASSFLDVQRAKWPIIDISVMNDKEWQFAQQDQFGRLYNPDDYVLFRAQMLHPETIAYMVDFYAHVSGSAIDSHPEHIGFCYILPSNLRETCGTCTMPITGNKHQPIGQLTVEYLIVRPLQNFACDCTVSYGRHWNKHKGLDVGHRGSGNARRSDKFENVLENTIASFNYAARHGADMVELDVQLSKDLVPVIYHDYYICIPMKKKKTPNDHELLEVAVKDLTAQQLKMLKLSPSKSGAHKYDFHEDDHDDNQPFPTLQHVLEAVDPKVGVNIEIKCPMQLRDGTWEMDGRFELNSYIDIILKAILEHAGSRHIILSCFHPDICTMIRLKQNKYPLLFLTQGKTEKYPPYLDTRTSSIPMATHFARSIGLLGINVHTEELLMDRSLIRYVKMRHLVLFCWGDDINHSNIIKELKQLGVDGVIYDRVDEFIAPKENVFLVESQARMAVLEAAGCSNESYVSWSSVSTNSVSP